MSEKQPSDQGIPDVNAIIMDKGPEFLIAYDLPRVWTTGAQAFVDPNVTNIVFREQSLFEEDDGKKQGLIRNVASVVMPTEVARQLRDVLVNQLDLLDGKPEE